MSQQELSQQGFAPHALLPPAFAHQGLPQQGLPQQSFSHPPLPHQSFPQDGLPQQGLSQQGLLQQGLFHQEPALIPYGQLPASPSLVLPFEEWEIFVKKTYPQQYGIVWNINNTYPPGSWAARNKKFDPEMTHESILKAGQTIRRRYHAHGFLVWRFTFVCHQGGKKRTHKSRVKGGISGKERTRQKASKKIGCKACLHVEYFENDPNHVYLTFVDGHNHAIGGADDTKSR